MLNVSRYPRNMPWRSVGVFPVGYENQLHIEKMQMFVPDGKHTYGPPRPVTEIALLL
jgi:hypothetical protein